MTGGLSNLKLSITNLWDEFGNTDNPLFGLVINVGLASLGVILWWATSGWVSFVGATWAILNLLGVVKWVIRA